MKPFYTIACRGLDATDSFGSLLANALAPGDCVCLSAPMGVGKTALARATIRAICQAPDLDVPSPTFTLVQYYEGPLAVAHADLYRSETSNEWDELGLDDALDMGIVLIEWPERMADRLPQRRIDIEGRTMPDGTRLWSITAPIEWQARMSE